MDSTDSAIIDGIEYIRQITKLEPPLLRRGDRTFQKLSHLGEEGTKFFARKGG